MNFNYEKPQPFVSVTNDYITPESVIFNVNPCNSHARCILILTLQIQVAHQNYTFNPLYTHLIIMYLARASTAEVCRRAQLNLDGFETTPTIKGSNRERSPVDATSTSQTLLMRSVSLSSAVAPDSPNSSSRLGLSVG